MTKNLEKWKFEKFVTTRATKRTEAKERTWKTNISWKLREIRKFAFHNFSTCIYLYLMAPNLKIQKKLSFWVKSMVKKIGYFFQWRKFHGKLSCRKKKKWKCLYSQKVTQDFLQTLKFNKHLQIDPRSFREIFFFFGAWWNTPTTFSRFF